MNMDEAGTAILEKPRIKYEPKPQELELQNNGLSRLQRIEGSPKIWYVDVDGVGGGIFKRKYAGKEINSDVENERAAYLISDIVGFDFVPTTVLRTIDGQEGCLQEFVEDTQDIDEVPVETLQGELYKYWIFRHILRSPEGHNYNLLIKEGKIISIDHEWSFDSDPSDPSYFDIDRSYYGVRAPDSLVDIFKSYLNDDLKQETLRSALTGIIDQKDIEITMQRLKTFGNLLATKGQVDSKEELTGENLW